MKKVSHKKKDVFELRTSGERICFERTKLGLSQNDLANKLSIARESINRIENNTKQIPTDILIKLSKMFDVSTDYLLCQTNGKTSQNIDISKELGLTDEAIEMLKYLKRTDYMTHESQVVNLLLTHVDAKFFFTNCAYFLYEKNEKSAITLTDGNVSSYTFAFDSEEALLLQIQKILRKLKLGMEGK